MRLDVKVRRVPFLCIDVQRMEDSLEMYASFVKETRQDLEREREESVQDSRAMIHTTDSVKQIQRQLFARSERVKGIDFHPVEPWILTTLYSGMFLGA